MDGANGTPRGKSRAHHWRGVRHRPATAALFHREGAKVAATDRNQAGLKALGPDGDLTLVQDVTDEARWREVVDAVFAPAFRAPRHSRQQRRNRDPRQYRDDDARRLSQGRRGQRGGRVSRLPRGGAGDEGHGRLDRQSLVGRGNHRRRLFARLLRQQRGGEAPHQIGRAAVPPALLWDPGELGASLVRRNADGA